MMVRTADVTCGGGDIDMGEASCSVISAGHKVTIVINFEL